MSDVDRFLISAKFLEYEQKNKNSEKAVHLISTDKSVVRFQFTEFVVRCALKKFYKAELAKTIGESVKLVLQDFLYQFYSKETESIWGSLDWRKD